MILEMTLLEKSDQQKKLITASWCLLFSSSPKVWQAEKDRHYLLKLLRAPNFLKRHCRPSVWGMIRCCSVCSTSKCDTVKKIALRRKLMNLLLDQHHGYGDRLSPLTWLCCTDKHYWWRWVVCSSRPRGHLRGRRRARRRRSRGRDRGSDQLVPRRENAAAVQSGLGPSDAVATEWC